MKIKYFTSASNLDELKSKYRELCKQHHPDKGGDTLTMQEINAEYSFLLKNQNFDFKGSSVEIEEELRNIIEQTVVLEGLIVELCGRWIWFSGNTYAWKDTLKKIGCSFASKKKMWFWRPSDEAHNRHTKTLSTEEIRAKYGSEVFAQKFQTALQGN